ncbi:MAG: UDP-glucose:(heptosyl)LPS alpha-1,3-glucosyltransferase [Halioglobus sp.]|jgi:UDP-glucose:(heptosyl)LPS alpha-1,3-glucosyltransferase
MRLAFLLYKYFPYGGMQRDFRRFVEESQKLGHHCRVYYISWQGEPIAEADLRQVPVSAMSNHRRNARFSQWVQSDLAQDPVDGVIGFNKMPGLDVYYAADSCYLDKAFGERSWWYRLGARYRHFSAYEEAVFSVQSKTHILLISETEKAKFKHYYDTPEERMHMLPPGIAMNRKASADAAKRRQNARAALGLKDYDHVLLFVGSGFIKKGLNRAIQSLANLHKTMPDKNIRLLVVGQDRETRFRRLAVRLRVANQIQFLGGRDDIPELLLAADALIHPAKDEAAGIVLLEALVAGLPVLVTDICGYAHHIERADAGVALSSPFQQGDLDRAVEHSLDSEFRSRCTENALGYADEEDLYSMHTTGAQLIEQFIEQKESAA